MRAFYSTQKHFLMFILGTPEGWQVSIYDLQKHEWVEKGGRIEDMLRTAKATAQEKTSLLLGKKAPELRWQDRNKSPRSAGGNRPTAPPWAGRVPPP